MASRLRVTKQSVGTEGGAYFQICSIWHSLRSMAKRETQGEYQVP